MHNMTKKVNKNIGNNQLIFQKRFFPGWGLKNGKGSLHLLC